MRSFEYDTDAVSTIHGNSAMVENKERWADQK